jgi:hypothetical protein
VKQISDKEIYLLIKYIKSVLWRVAKSLSYIEEARCLKVNERPNLTPTRNNRQSFSSVYLDIYIVDITPTQTVVLTYVSVYLCSVFFQSLVARHVSGYYTKMGRSSVLKILIHLTLLKLRHLFQRFDICMRVDGEWAVTVAVCGPLSCGAVAVCD